MTEDERKGTAMSTLNNATAILEGYRRHTAEKSSAHHGARHGGSSEVDVLFQKLEAMPWVDKGSSNDLCVDSLLKTVLPEWDL